MSDSQAIRRNVFVVHGRNMRARDAIFDFLRVLDLHPIEWVEARKFTGNPNPYVGEILDAAFERAQAVVVIMTPEDITYLDHRFASPHDPEYETTPTPQARANVIFEAGIAMGRATQRTILVELGKLRPFSDIGGRHVLRMDGSLERRQELAHRLSDAGCPVNMTGTAWHHAGDFDLTSLGILNYSTADLKKALVDNRFPTNVTPDAFHRDSIVSFALDRLNEPFLRGRATKLMIHHAIVDDQLLRRLALDASPEVRIELATGLRALPFPLPHDVLELLIADQSKEVAEAAVEAAYAVAKASPSMYPSALFRAASAHKSWEVRYKAISRVIWIDDDLSVETLTSFANTTYHLSRNAIRKYFERLHAEGRLSGQSRTLALDLLRHFLKDGKSSDTTERKLADSLSKLTQ